MNAFAFTATCLVISKETVPKFPIGQNAEQKDTHRTDAPTSHRGPDMHTKLANLETNKKGMKISHSFQAITISVCSVQEIIRPQIVHDNNRPQPLTVLLVVQVLPLTKMHLAPHTPLFILIRNHQPHTVNLHCMYKHQLLTLMLPHFHLICTKPLYHHMHKIEPITIILINSKCTHHQHSILIHSFHSLLTLMSHCHIFHNTCLLTVHLLIALILQSC